MNRAHILELAKDSKKLIQFYNKKAFRRKIGKNYENGVDTKKIFIEQLKYEKEHDNNFITIDDVFNTIDDVFNIISFPNMNRLNPKHIGPHSAKKGLLLHQNKNTDLSPNNENFVKEIKEYVKEDEDDIVEIALKIMYGIKTPKQIIDENLMSFDDIATHLKALQPPIPTFPHISADSIENSIIQPMKKFMKKEDIKKKNMRTLLHFLSYDDLRQIKNILKNIEA